jgi:hypothetical protein
MGWYQVPLYLVADDRSRIRCALSLWNATVSGGANGPRRSFSRPHAGGPRALCDEAASGCVRQLVQAQADAPLAELCEQLSMQ